MLYRYLENRNVCRKKYFTYDTLLLVVQHSNRISVIEPWLLVFDAKFSIHGSDDTLNLAHRKHSAEQGVAGIVSVGALIKHTTRLVGEGHAMIDTHRETATRVALAFLLCLLKDAAKFYQVGTATKVGCLREVAVREDVARTEMYEMGAVGKLLRHSHTVVVLTC